MMQYKNCGFAKIYGRKSGRESKLFKTFPTSIELPAKNSGAESIFEHGLCIAPNTMSPAPHAILSPSAREAATTSPHSAPPLIRAAAKAFESLTASPPISATANENARARLAISSADRRKSKNKSSFAILRVYVARDSSCGSNFAEPSATEEMFSASRRAAAAAIFPRRDAEPSEGSIATSAAAHTGPESMRGSIAMRLTPVDLNPSAIAVSTGDAPRSCGNSEAWRFRHGYLPYSKTFF